MPKTCESGVPIVFQQLLANFLPSPVGPKKGIDKGNLICLFFSWKLSGSIRQVFGFSWGPGRFRELREASRNRFHLSWYLRVPGIANYGQKH